MEEFRTDSLSLLGIELHIITSAVKPLSGWIMRDAIQSSREACAGHGYLKGFIVLTPKMTCNDINSFTAAGFGELRNNQDATLTYEGENWVLIQQTSNFLLKLLPNISEGVEVTSPLGSIDFLNNISNIMKTRFSAQTFQDIIKPESKYVLHHLWSVTE